MKHSLKWEIKRRRKIRDYFKALGPGVITGAADNDPSGVVTYLQVGSFTKFSQLWLMFLTIPMLTVVEEMSARIGVVTKKGLSAVISKEFGFKVAFFAIVILTICNITTVGADIAAMAEVLGLLLNIKIYILLIFPISLLIIYFLISENYKIVSRFLFLTTPILIVYIVNAFLAHPQWGEVIKSTLIPKIHFGNLAFLTAAVALMGTTISPYLMFWQTTEEVEGKKTVKELHKEKFDVITGMVYCNLVFYFIIISGAVALPGASIGTAGQAALSLKFIGSGLGMYLFSIGILGSGLIAVPVLASSTAYAIADIFHWKEGLGKTLVQAKSFYLVIILALLAGSLIGFLGIAPMKMLFYSQVLQGILTPILLVFLIKITNSKKIMGQHTNGKVTNFLGILTAVVMIGFSLLMFWEIIKNGLMVIVK